MYIVTIINSGFETEIHGEKEKLISGKVVKGINTIDSFTFSMMPDSEGFYLINEFTTIVTVFNTNKNKYDFIGRVLYAETTMNEDGFISKNVTCENIFGYLCDSVQTYVATKNWTIKGLFQHMIDCHNSQVEEYKRFKVGDVTVTDTNDNLYVGIQRDNTWEAIKTKLIDSIGGELQYRIEEDGIYIDYLQQIGEFKETKIALSVNMKSITREQNPTSYITRLIPLGCKKTDVEGNETEERLDITAVNNGKDYIEDAEAAAVYGIHAGVAEWDDVTTAHALLSKGQAWLKEKNKVQIKYSITALDLSLIGLAEDDFEIGNTHPIENELLAIDDAVRIIKKNIDVCEEVKSTIEVGDNFKALSDIQREQAAQMQTAIKTVKNLENSNEAVKLQIRQLTDSIKLEVTGNIGEEVIILFTSGTNSYPLKLDLSKVREAFANDETDIDIKNGLVAFGSGTMKATDAVLDGTTDISSLVLKGTDDKRYRVTVNEGALECSEIDQV